MSQSNISTDQISLLDNSTLDAIFSLAEAKDLSGMLHLALKTVIRTFQAKGGSLFFSQPEYRIRVGSFSPALNTHVIQLEDAVSARLQTGDWHILDPDTPLISVQKFPEKDLLLVNTPLLKETQVLGSLSLVLPENDSFNAAPRTTLNHFARGIGRLASSISNASFAKTQHKELDLIYQVGQTLASTLDITELLETIMQLSANMLDAAASSILLIDETKQELVFEVTHSPIAALLNKYRITLDEGIAGWVATHGRPVFINDVHRDPRFNRRVDVRTGFLTQSIAAVPLKLKGKVIGVLEALNKYAESGFDDDDLRLMTSIAAQAAIALENAKLYQSVKQEHEKIIEAQEEVRKALSRTLHDGTVQQLAAISMRLEYTQKLLRVDPDAAYNELLAIRESALKASKDARLLLFELRPVILETQGLLSALKRYVTQLNEKEDFTVEADLSPLPKRFSKNIAGTIFSIIREAVNNAKRHANASHLKITVSTTERDLLVQIKDNGTGFDVKGVQDRYAGRNSLGLLNMKERTELINGVLTIDSQTDGTDCGTTIILSVPLKSDSGLLKQSLLLVENYEHN